MRRRTLHRDSFVIIFQVGSVGDPGFNFFGFNDQKLNILIEYLQENYGLDYEIIHYIASQYPVSSPRIEYVKLSDILKPEISKKVTGISTFCIPLKDVKPINFEMAKKLGMKIMLTFHRD